MSDWGPDRLPIKIDPTSNGEFRPVPLTETVARANALAAERLTSHARRVGVARRAFLQSLCGAATTLLTLNQAFAARGNTGGSFRLPAEAAFETAAADSALAGDEFIFDVQTHLVDPAGKWRANAGQYWEQILARFPHGSCGDADPVDCFSAEQFIKHVFLDSDTQLAVLSFVPELPENNPLSLEEAERVRVLVEQMEGAHRLFLHAMVVPNAGPEIAPLQLMQDAVARYPIAAWKSYTQWGPDGVGWELDSPEVGIPFIEQAKALGVHNICIHKGLLFDGFPEEYGRCADVGRAAKLFPDMNFIIYHSGYEAGSAEGPFDPDRAERGVDTLIKSVLDNDIGPERQRLRRARQHLALRDARSDHRRPPARQAAQARRPGQRALGHGFDLVRLAAGPDPGVPHVPDRGRADRGAWISAAHPGAQGQGLRPQRCPGLRRRGPRAEEEDRGRPDRPQESGLPRAGRADLRDLRTEDRPRVRSAARGAGRPAGVAPARTRCVGSGAAR